MIKTEAYNESTQFLGLTTKNGFKAGKLYTQKPLSAADAFVVNRNLAAYRINQLGVLELMAANVPRVDYKNGCPEILIENEATNIILQSESLTLSFGGVIGTNDTTAPNGTMTADSFNVNDNTSGGTYKAITLVNGNTYTYSVWLKGSVNGQKVLSQTDFNGDLLTFTLTTEWVRYSVTFVANSSSAQNIYLLNGLYVTPTSNEIYYTWGQQLELGKLTSYIPTTTTSVTRPPDIIENNTINYDINQGTIFVRARLDFSTDVRGIITLYDGGAFENYITIYSEIIGAVKKIVFQTYTDPDENKYELTVPSNGIYNMAFAYDLTANTYAIAVNGNIEFSGTFAISPPTSSELTTLTLGRIGSFYDARVIGLMFFDSKLDNTSLENLTA